MTRIKDENTTIAFKGKGLDPGVLQFLFNLQERKEGAEFIHNAINFYYEFYNYKKGFLIKLLNNDFELCKHLLRQIGATRKRDLDK